MAERKTQSVLTAVYDSLRAAENITPRDAAAAALAKRAAALVDDGELRAMAPLMAALRELGLTPRARSAMTVKGGRDGTNRAPRSLDELRARRAKRSARPN